MQTATLINKCVCDYLQGQGPSGDQLTIKVFTENNTWSVDVFAVCLERERNVPVPSNSGFCHEDSLQRPDV